MDNYDEILRTIIEKLNPTAITEDSTSLADNEIPVGISNRHLHLSSTAVEKLFGPGYQLTKLKDLSQPGQYACRETVMICGPKGAIQHVRILGPTRQDTQIEILQSDTFKLGISAPLRLSGDLANTPTITIVGPKGSIETRGVIVAQRHIHMLPTEAQKFGVSDGEAVTIEFSGLRGGSLNNVIIRAQGNSGLECHIDTEEANALGVTPGMKITIKK